MSEDNAFTFDDDTKDVLSSKKTSQKKTGKKPGRPMSEGVPKNRPVTCYLTEDEYATFMDSLDGRSASLYLRKMILKDIEK